MYQLTKALKKINKLTKRIRAIAGGTAAGKTVAILLYLINYAQKNEKKIISVVSESFPHLKRGAMRDFLDIMTKHRYFKEGRWNRTDYVYTFETGSIIEFFSADQPGKVRGPRRDVLFINEANNIGYEIYTQLEVRTKEFIFLDWNPVNEFWFYSEILNKREDVDFITLTYKDNDALPEDFIKALEARKSNSSWWRVYGEGLLGEMESKIYKGWQIIDEIPYEARLERRGLDFGYTNNPSALVAVYYYNGGYILDEELYQKGLSNRELANIILAKEHQVLVMADSSEPKSIDELKSYGVLIEGAVKGKDSVNYGIQVVQDQKISVTKRSVNLIKEYRNYFWQKDKDGRIINEPNKYLDHLLDASRYAIVSIVTGGIRAEEEFLRKIKDELPEEKLFDKETGLII